MKLGFIGTGQISKAVINGIINSKINYSKIYISKRNTKISSNLKRKSKKILIFKNNQEIINRSDWVFLAVTPSVGNKILKNLKFKKKQTVISFISTIKMNELKKYIKVTSKIVRATGYHSLVPNVVGAIRADLVQCIKTDWQRSKAATSSIGKIRFSSHWIRKEFKPRLVKIKTFATSESEHTQHGDDYARSTIDAITQYLAIN